MICRFRHKGLERLYRDDDAKGVIQSQASRLRRLLLALDAAKDIRELDLPGFRLHRLKGNRKSEWSISVSGNWRLTFRFDDSNVLDLDYEDYH